MDGKKDIDEIGLSKLCRQSFQVYIKCKIFIFSAINDRYFPVTEMEREVETITVLDMLIGDAISEADICDEQHQVTLNQADILSLWLQSQHGCVVHIGKIYLKARICQH